MLNPANTPTPNGTAPSASDRDFVWPRRRSATTCYTVPPGSNPERPRLNSRTIRSGLPGRPGLRAKSASGLSSRANCYM